MLGNSAHSLRIFREQWLTGYCRLRRPILAAWRKTRAEQQQIIAVHVEKLGSLRLYDDLPPLLERAPARKLTATHSAVFSPFSPVAWDRKCAEQLFNFNYRLEYYTSAPKCQYDHSVLPLLHCGQLIGRMDAKIHRQTGILEVITLWLQEDIKPTTTL